MRPSSWKETFEEGNVSEEHFRTLVDTAEFEPSS